MIDDNNKISKIKKDYMAGKTYKQIAQKHDVTYNEVLYLVKKKNWKRKSNLSKVKKGNQNAKGNKGGPGAEKAVDAILNDCTPALNKLVDIATKLDEETECNLLTGHCGEMAECYQMLIVSLG